MRKAEWVREVQAAIEKSGSASECGVELNDRGNIEYFDFYPRLRTPRRISFSELVVSYLHGSEVRRLKALRS